MTPQDLNPKKYITTKEQQANLEKLATVISELENLYGETFVVTSGLRSYADQMRINPRVKNSAHLTGEAGDFLDLDKRIYNWCTDNLEVIAALGLYIEDGSVTKRWIHLQIRVTKSGNIVFIP